VNRPPPAIVGLDADELMALAIVLHGSDCERRHRPLPRYRPSASSVMAHRVLGELRARVPPAELAHTIAVAEGLRQPQSAAELALLRGHLALAVAVARR